GMAHRGRLNVLSHVMGKPYDQILAEFEGRAVSRRTARSDATDDGWTDDVKYHAGGRRAYRGQDGTVTVQMAPNPSHLEYVNPVVHVNADDPVAYIADVGLAVGYQTIFRPDFLIVLIGYRRWGHNEGDEPAFTQPRTYALIAGKPTVRELFVRELDQRGVVPGG